MSMSIESEPPSPLDKVLYLPLNIFKLKILLCKKYLHYKFHGGRLAKFIHIKIYKILQFINYLYNNENVRLEEYILNRIYEVNNKMRIRSCK